MTATDIIITIWKYENSIERPEYERFTFTDEHDGNKIKFSDYVLDNDADFVQKYHSYAEKCVKYLEFGDDVKQATVGAFPSYAQLKVCDMPDIFFTSRF